MKTTKKIIFTILLTSIFGLGFYSCKSTEKKNDPNFLGDFDGQGVAKMMAGSVKLIGGKIKPLDINFFFYPRTNILSANFRNKGRSWDSVYINLTQENRESITQSIKAFLEAYNTQSLTVKDNKKKAFFGKTETNLAWGLFGASREAYPTLRCEYQLLTDNKPYFILANTMVKAKDEACSPALRMAFSPAQCEDLLAILKQENLIKIVDYLQTEFTKYDNNDGEKEKTEKEEKKINYK